MAVVRPGGQFGEGDGADRHLVREFGGVDPATQDEDVGVERPCRERADVSPLIRVAVLEVGDCVLVGAECVQVAERRVAGHCRELE